MPLLPRSTSKGDTSLKNRRNSINSNDDDQTSTLLISTKDTTDDENAAMELVGGIDLSPPPSTPIPTIYSNDYDFDIENNLKNKATSRSFIRPAKTLGQEHRNRSVPHNLQVRQNYCLLDWFCFLICKQANWHKFICWFYIENSHTTLNIHFCGASDLGFRRDLFCSTTNTKEKRE